MQKHLRPLVLEHIRRLTNTLKREQRRAASRPLPRMALDDRCGFEQLNRLLRDERRLLVIRRKNRAAV